jgi:predicted RNA-binding Zn-ribbon protein involved in translation (DUF1610 family)
MKMNPPQPEYIHLSCTQCGNQMNYDASTAQMLCPSCGTTREVPRGNDLIVEKSFADALALGDTSTGWGVATHDYTCRNCGAITTTSASEPVLVCSFCASEAINETAFDTRLIRPAGLLPFAIDNRKALDLYKNWLGKGWFHPSNLSALARLDRIQGVYVPFWTFDAQTDSYWTAEAGYYYYVTVTDTDANGNTVERQEQRIRWVPVSGFFQYFFDDVLVVASRGIEQRRIERIYPFPLNAVINYAPQFLAGWKAEVYAVDLEEGFKRAEAIMDKHLQSLISSQIPGDTHRFLAINTHKYNITYKHILLPVWIAAYLYQGKSFQVIINGVSGRVTGEKPYSAWKIALAILLGLLVLLVLYFLFGKQ